MAPRRLHRLSIAAIMFAVVCTFALSNVVVQADVQIEGSLCASSNVCGSPFSCVGNGTYSVCFDLLHSNQGSPNWYGLTLSDWASGSECGDPNGVEKLWDSYVDGTCGADPYGGQHRFQNADAGFFGRFVKQADGNAVVYDQFGQAVWHTGTNGFGSNTQLVLRDNGDLVMYYNHSYPLWVVF